MMEDQDVIPMHEDFARWYSSVQLENNPSRRQARWNGVLAVVKAAELVDVEALVRLAFRSRKRAAESSVQKIRGAFRKADDLFEPEGNERELEVLAGTCLVALMDRGGTVGAFAALAISTTSLAGARKADVPMDLCAQAETAIDRIASADRKRPSLEIWTSADPLNLSFEGAADSIRNAGDWSECSDAFTSALADIQSGMETVAQQQAKFAGAVSQFFRVQDEELQMLWWLTGQRSWEYDCPLDEVPDDARPLALAKELANFTELPPGPPSILALLSRAGLKEQARVRIPEAINSSDNRWLARIVGEEEPSPVSSPIHYAIKRQVEVGNEHAWVAGWAAATDVNPDHSISPLQLGVLFYRERLLWELK